MSLRILQIGTLGPMARIIIKETEVMAIRFNPVGEINLHGKNLALSQSVRKMNLSSRKLAENQAGRDSSQQLAVSSYQLVVGGAGARNNIQESRFWPPILRMLFCDGPLGLFQWSRYLKRPHKESDNYPHGFDKRARYSLIILQLSGKGLSINPSTTRTIFATSCGGIRRRSFFVDLRHSRR